MRSSRTPQPMSALRREIYGERPLAPLLYPPVIYRPRRSKGRIAFWIMAIASEVFIAAILVVSWLWR